MGALQEQQGLLSCRSKAAEALEGCFPNLDSDPKASQTWPPLTLPPAPLLRLCSFKQLKGNN